MLQCSKRNCANRIIFSFGHLDLDNLDLPFDFAQDREPVEWLVEPFRI